MKKSLMFLIVLCLTGARVGYADQMIPYTEFRGHPVMLIEKDGKIGLRVRNDVSAFGNRDAENFLRTEAKRLTAKAGIVPLGNSGVSLSFTGGHTPFCHAIVTSEKAGVYQNLGFAEGATTSNGKIIVVGAPQESPSCR